MAPAALDRMRFEVGALSMIRMIKDMQLNACLSDLMHTVMVADGISVQHKPFMKAPHFAECPQQHSV